MNGKKARELRRIRWGDAFPDGTGANLLREERIRLWVPAEYMAKRLRGEDALPPSHWPPEQVAEFEAILADPAERAGLLKWGIEGWRKVHGFA